MRREKRDKAQFSTLYEIVLQTYVLPFSDFVAVNPRLDPTRLTTIRFIFDRSVAGTVVLDDVGFSPLGRVIETVNTGSR
jgi:hypothetical protein